MGMHACHPSSMMLDRCSAVTLLAKQIAPHLVLLLLCALADRVCSTLSSSSTTTPNALDSLGLPSSNAAPSAQLVTTNVIGTVSTAAPHPSIASFKAAPTTSRVIVLVGSVWYT
jgi:hypothetical protein